MPVLLRADHLPRRARLRAVRPGRPTRSSVYDALRPPARRTACGRSGSRRWRRCGWRRPTATSATTSTTPTARSRSGSASRVALDKPAVSSAGRRCSPRKAADAAGDASGWCRSGCSTPSRCCTTPSRCSATAWSVGYVRAASYGWTLGAAVGLAFVERRRAGHHGLAGRRHLGGRRRRRRGTPPRSRCGRCTTRPARGSAPEPACDVVRLSADGARARRAAAGRAAAAGVLLGITGAPGRRQVDAGDPPGARPPAPWWCRWTASTSPTSSWPAAGCWTARAPRRPSTGGGTPRCWPGCARGPTTW